MRLMLTTTFCMTLSFAVAVRAQVNTTSTDGGSVITALSDDIAINKGSSLHRRWIVIHDSRMPVDISAPCGLKTEYSGDRGYHLTTELSLQATEPIYAYEVRVLIFDVWGDFLVTYVQGNITDLPAGANTAKLEWYTSDEERVGYVQSIAYVSRVFTQAGKVINADDSAVLAEAKKISAQIKVEDLTPSSKK